MDKYAKYLILMFLLCNLICASRGEAATINAASCSLSDVQAAINSASDGDTVRVPAGNCTWSSTLSITDKSFILQGAGIDNTKITSSGTAVIRVRGQTDDYFRITGFTLENTSGTYIIQIGGTDPNYYIAHNRNWRIDHVKLVDTTGGNYGVYVSGDAYGVIDNCIFEETGQSIFVEQPDPNDPELFGDIAWTKPIDWGGPNAVYIEDCIFNGGRNTQVADGRWGGRFVFRYNTVTDCAYYLEPHSGCSNGHRAIMHTEIYENVFKEDRLDIWIAIRIRGGTGVIFNNDFDSGFSAGPVFIDNERSCLTDCYGPWRSCVCNGNCKYDGNTPGYQGWPCIDQIGRGANQASDPMYGWGNEECSNPPCNGSGTDVDIQVKGLGCGRDVNYHLIENRDFYNDTKKPGYKPYSYPHPLRTNGDTTPPSPPMNPRLL